MKKTIILVGCMLVFVFIFVGCGGYSPTPIPAPTDTPIAPTDTPIPVPTDTPIPVPTDTPVAPTAVPQTGPVEIPGFPLKGSSMQNTDHFQINGSITLAWTCANNSSQPFGIQVWDSSSGKYDTPVGTQISDTSSGCSGSQTIDFGGKSFLGFIGITAIGDWTLDAQTNAS